MSRRRKPYNFDEKTKLEALRFYNFRCVVSGKHKSECDPPFLYIHHCIAIWCYLEYKQFFNSIGIDDDFIRSSRNAVPLCKEEHEKIHEKESFEYYKRVAIALLGLANSGD